MSMATKDRIAHNKECQQKLIDLLYEGGYTSITYWNGYLPSHFLNELILKAGYQRDYISHECDRASIQLAIKYIIEDSLTEDKNTCVQSMMDQLKDFYLKEIFKNQYDQICWERHRLVAMLACIFPSFLGEEKDGSRMVYITLPTGQISFHVSEQAIILFMPLHKNPIIEYDGHTDDDKWRRTLFFILNGYGDTND